MSLSRWIEFSEIFCDLFIHYPEPGEKFVFHWRTGVESSNVLKRTKKAYSVQNGYICFYPFPNWTQLNYKHLRIMWLFTQMWWCSYRSFKYKLSKMRSFHFFFSFLLRGSGCPWEGRAPLLEMHLIRLWNSQRTQFWLHPRREKEFYVRWIALDPIFYLSSNSVDEENWMVPLESLGVGHIFSFERKTLNRMNN